MDFQPTEQQLRFQKALAELVKQIEADRTILAAILCGSLSYDQVWEKSDIDLLLVTTEDLKELRHYTLLADGIDVHAVLYPRGKFKKMMQSTTQGSFMHSLFWRSTLLFSKDETLLDLYEGARQLGARDREIQCLNFATGLLGVLTKAEKWWRAKKDYRYAYFYITKCLDSLAAMEVTFQGEVAGREVIQQALRLNPQVFEPLYTGLMDAPKTEANVGEAIQNIYAHLEARTEIFRPVLEYLDSAGGPRSASDIDHHFQHHYDMECASFACEWLAGRGIIEKLGLPVRLVEKSRVQVEEAAYYYSA